MLEITNPVDATVIRRIATTSREQLAAQMDAARAAADDWRLDHLRRDNAIRKFKAIVARDTDELALALTLETGKPIAQAKGEIRAFLGRIDYFLEVVPRCLQSQTVYCDETIQEEISFDPLGIVGCISAWNYPYFVGGNVFIPALLTGNCVLYKPSEIATLTGLAIAERLHAAGVPAPVFTTLVGDARVGVMLTEASIDGLYFTGSVATGRAIRMTLADRLIPLQLELGGKDAVYVSDDIPVEGVAASVAEGAFYNAGQSCCSVERIYVHVAVYEAFVSALLEVVSRFVIGDPRDADTYIGPLARRAQLDVLERQIDDAVRRGGRIAFGGKRLSGPGNFFAPTVMTHVPNDALIVQKESFGPMVTITAVADDAEAVRLMDDTCYGLTAGIYTTSRERAQRLLSALDVGSCYWNSCDRVSPRLPWSGRRQSGIGVTLSEQGVRAFLRPRAWHWLASS
jgi:acyl-CoA reductase-like NAD-dependent aldehyde dehydrogenase